MRHHFLLLALATLPWVPAIAAEHPVDPAAGSGKTVAIPPPDGVSTAGFLGVGLDEVDPALAYQLELKDGLGALVMMVSPGSPAATMGIKPYDVITGADGREIHGPQELSRVVRAKPIGETISIEVRRGATTTTLSGQVAARPPETEAQRGPALRRSMPGHSGDLPRRGTMQLPDGSQAEWSIEGEQPQLGLP